MAGMLKVLSTLYAAGARRRRERYARRPDLRRRLRHPVISVGNLAMGGRGKTPMAAAIAKMLVDMGERPAILSRGYARTRPDEGVVIVRDQQGIHADLPRAGDEPLMLARQLPGVAVLVSPDRYLAGRLAEHHLGVTVHVLDDGFQHLQLERDIDVLILAREDIACPWTVPAGRLREPLDTMIVADAILTADDEVAVDPAGPPIPVFRMRRMAATPETARFDPAYAVAGIAEPSRFFADVREAGWPLVGNRAFPDHHAFSRPDVDRLFTEARGAGAATVVTTEKDLVRLLPFRPFPMPVVAVPLVLEPEPIDEFRAWLDGSLRAARDEVRG
jgi:tetraacyldisaccharide 4'-kinase